MAIVKRIKSRNTNYSVDIDNMYEFASSHCTDFKDLRDINVNIKMYIFDHLRMYIFAILPLDRYIFLSDKIFL